MNPARVVPAREGVGEHEDRGSRFVAHVFRAPDEEAFRVRLDALRDAHAKARHHCWAWRIGKAYRFSDDGEPGGTAGRPMLQALETADLEDVGAVCVRWFGGVKLGTGGLVRAYGAATARAVEAAGRHTLVPRAKLRMELPYDLLGLRGEIEALFPGAEFDGGFDERAWQGIVEMNAADLPRLCVLLEERAAGRARWERAEDC